MPAFWKAWKDQENDPRPGQPAAVQQPPAAQPTVTPAPPPPPPAQPAAQAGRTRTQPLPQASSGDKTSRTSTFPRIIGVRGRTASGKLPQYNGPPLHKEFFRRYALEWDTLCDWLIKAFPEDKYPGLKFKEEFDTTKDSYVFYVPRKLSEIEWKEIEQLQTNFRGSSESLRLTSGGAQGG